MAYDIHIAKTEKLAERVRRVADWSYEEHSAIFEKSRLNRNEFPLLCRMSDYYADASFGSEKLGKLIDEIEIAMGKLKTPLAIAAINKLASAAREARKSDLSVFCFCD